MNSYGTVLPMPFTKGHKLNVGRLSWNKGIRCPQLSIKLKGRPTWNKGKHLSETHRLHLSESHRGLHISPATQFKKGQKAWNKGKSHMVREKHWHWKGGIENLVRHDIRADSAYGRWQTEVKRRDKNKCQLSDENCTKTYIAHHILPWASHPEERYDVDNGITLCSFHHPRTRQGEKALIPTLKALILKQASIKSQ